MRTIALVSVSLSLAAGACSTPTAPAKPTWSEDVQPIMVGSCGQCHGATAEPTGFRLDICDHNPFIDTGYVFEGTINSASRGIAPGDILSQVQDDVMPPPPGGALSKYEKDVLANWVALGDAAKKAGKDVVAALCGKRSGNHKPTLRVIGSPVYANGGVSVKVEVADADEDQVEGSIFVGPDCDPTPPAGYKPSAKPTDPDYVAPTDCMMRPRGPLPGTGRRTIRIESGVADGDPLVIRYSDGWSETLFKEL